MVHGRRLNNRKISIC